MSVAARPVRLDFDDYFRHPETHPGGAFELLDGAIFKLAPDRDAHLHTRSAIDPILNRILDLTRDTPWTEASLPASGWFEGPKSDNFVSRWPGIVDGVICARPQAADILRVIEVSSSTRQKDDARARFYARLAISEYRFIELELERGAVLARVSPTHGEGDEYRSVVAPGATAKVACAPIDELGLTSDFLFQFVAQFSSMACLDPKSSAGRLQADAGSADL